MQNITETDVISEHDNYSNNIITDTLHRFKHKVGKKSGGTRERCGVPPCSLYLCNIRYRIRTGDTESRILLVVVEMFLKKDRVNIFVMVHETGGIARCGFRIRIQDFIDVNTPQRCK